MAAISDEHFCSAHLYDWGVAHGQAMEVKFRSSPTLQI